MPLSQSRRLRCCALHARRGSLSPPPPPLDGNPVVVALPLPRALVADGGGDAAARRDEVGVDGGASDLVVACEGVVEVDGEVEHERVGRLHPEMCDRYATEASTRSRQSGGERGSPRRRQTRLSELSILAYTP